MRAMEKSDFLNFNVNVLENWDPYFISLRKYLEYFRSCEQIPSMRGFSLVSVAQMIAENELAALLEWADAATRVAQSNPEIRRQMNEMRAWNCVENIVGLLACSIPLVLKGRLYCFLAALAIDENISIHIWNCLISSGICMKMNDGKLSGIQQDLEEQECVAKAYDCSQGFLQLMKELFHHKTRPGFHQLAPYLNFIVNSIICQFISRTYVDAQQMWELAKIALDSLYELLRMFYVTQRAVVKHSSEVWLLTQLLNNTPLLVNVLNIIVECHELPRLSASSKDVVQASASAGASEGPVRNVKRDNASLAAIRLIYMAVTHRSALADAIRAVGSNLMVCTLEALMFSPLPNFGKSQHANANCLSLLFSYISEKDFFLKHTFYVVRILRNLCCQRPSLQKQIVQAAIVGHPTLATTMAQLTNVVDSDAPVVEVLHTDLLFSDMHDDYSLERIRGEIVRNLFETFIDSIRPDHRSVNLAYMIFGFDHVDINNIDVSIAKRNENESTCFYNVLNLANMVAEWNDCFDGKFSALYEPCLRLLLKLSAFTSMSEPIVLRIMRSHYDLVYKLATSAVFRRVDSPVLMSGLSRHSLSKDSACATMILRKSLQCIILELIALEFSSLLIGHNIERSGKLLSALINESVELMTTIYEPFTELDNTFSTTTDVSVQELKERVLLWSLLEQSKIDADELMVPVCTKFDSQKVDELLRFCIHKNSCNIDQYDIEYLHLLLNTEINSIVYSEMGLIKREARDILEYCAESNAKNLLEGSCVHMLSGWLSIINVLALHSPLAFLDEDVNKKILVDALFMLKAYCFCVEANAEVSSMVSSCMFRAVRALCTFYTTRSDDPLTRSSIRQALFPIVHLLLQCLALPRYSKCVRFKLDIYGGILCIFDMCNRLDGPSGTSRTTTTNQLVSADTLSASKLDKTTLSTFTRGTTNLTALMEAERRESECWSTYFESISSSIVDTISSDITYAPLFLKIAATASLSDIIHEDIVHSKNVAYNFVYSGSMACVLDTLSRVVTEFRNEKKDVKMNANKCRKQLLLVKAIFSLFTRLAVSEHGWATMINGRIFERLLQDDSEENGLAGVELQSKDDTHSVRLFRKLIETMSKF